MLGFVTTGVALQGWNGTDWAKGTRYRSILVIFPMYDTAFQFAALKALRSSRSTISPDCESAFVHGRVLGTYVPEIFKILGITADIASEDRTNGLADGRR